MKKTASDIIHTLEQVLPPHRPIPLHEPFFLGNEKKYINDCIDSRFVSSIGNYVTEFEKMLSRFTGSPFAVATSNGTSALHAALLAAGVQPGDEVLMPAPTFVATANAATYCGAVPHFIDSCPETLGIDIENLEKYLNNVTHIKNNTLVNSITRCPVRAIIPVHIFGIPVDMNRLQKLCQKFCLSIVEDAAESIGSFCGNRHTGTFGICGTLSFNGNKTITTGGGGAVLCSNEDTAQKLKHLTTTARCHRSRWEYFHDMTGFNYRMPNINAAIGCAQIEQLPEFLTKKRELAAKYAKAFDSVQGVHMLKEPGYGKSNFWLNTLILDRPDRKLLNDILEKTNSMGIQTRPVWRLMNTLPMYRECPSMPLECAQRLEDSVINIPSSINLLE